MSNVCARWTIDFTVFYWTITVNFRASLFDTRRWRLLFQNKTKEQVCRDISTIKDKKVKGISNLYAVWTIHFTVFYWTITVNFRVSLFGMYSNYVIRFIFYHFRLLCIFALVKKKMLCYTGAKGKFFKRKNSHFLLQIPEICTCFWVMEFCLWESNKRILKINFHTTIKIFIMVIYYHFFIPCC